MTTIKEIIENIETCTYRHIVSLSGGKDSTALAIYLKRHYPQIPYEYVFCDTGKELPETYDYLGRLQALLGEPIHYLNALDLRGVERKLGRTAFDVWLNEVYGGFLPNPRSRWCTRVLKIEPFERYVGEEKAYSYIGIRGDENREGYISRKPPVLSQRPNIISVYPFKDDGIGLSEVTRILEDSGLGLPRYYEWRSRSGCFFCFYQQIGEWQGLKEQHPDLFEIAKQYEKISGNKRFTWIDGRTLDDIVALRRREAIQKEDQVEGCAICHL